jgi:hypothetical protein
MTDTVIINVVEVVEEVTITVTEVLGRDGEQGVPGDGYTHTSEEFTGTTNAAITLANAYISGSIKLFKNSARLNRASYTESETGIVLNVPRIEEDEFIIDYKY